VGIRHCFFAFFICGETVNWQGGGGKREKKGGDAFLKLSNSYAKKREKKEMGGGEVSTCRLVW